MRGLRKLVWGMPRWGVWGTIERECSSGMSNRRKMSKRISSGRCSMAIGGSQEGSLKMLGGIVVAKESGA